MDLLHVGDEKDFGRVLKELRQRAKLSVRVLARKVGISASTLWGWEANEHVPNTRGLLKLLHFYAVTVTVGVEPNVDHDD